MKDKISTVLKSKSFYIVFSIMLAIGAWLLVVGSKNPTESRTLEVPVTFVNKNVLEENNLVDNSATNLTTTVNVKVSGSEVFLDRLQPSDLYVEVDYGHVKGPGDITLEIKEPICEILGVSVDSYYPMTIERVYDKIVERYIDVDIEWNEDTTVKGVSVVNAIAEPSSILVTGYSLDVNRIASVKVNLSDIGSQLSESGSVSLPCHFYDESGVEITGDFDTEKIVVRYTIGKIVPVEYKITGTPADGYFVSSHLPSVTSVTITGDTETINNISSLNLGSISIQGKKQTFTETVMPSNLLPEGVSVVGVSQIDVSVNIGKYSSKMFALDENKLKVSGEKSGYNYSYKLNWDEISLKGTETALKNVTEESVSMSIDVSALGEGTHKNINVTVTLPDGVTKQENVSCTVTVVAPETKATPTVAPTVTPDTEVEITPGQPTQEP